MMAAPITFVSAADGVKVAAHDLGGTGHPLVMAHAAGFHGLVLTALAQHLVGDFHCVSLDSRGHGDSSLPSGRALDWYGLAADILAVVDDLGLDRPYGFGHSSGGTAVLMAEQARPATFAAIYCFEPIVIPADPPLGRDDDNWLAFGARRRRTTFASREEAFRQYASKPPLDAAAPEVVQAYVDHGFEETAEGAVRLKCRPENEASVYAMATAHDAYSRLADIGCPVMVACGSETDACTPEKALAIAQLLPRGRRDILDGLGHIGPMERPEQVAESIRRFFSGEEGVRVERR